MMISKHYRFMVFVLYRIQLKKDCSINNAKAMAAANISALQMMVFLFLVFVVWFFLNLTLYPLRPLLYFMILLIYVANYYLYVKKDYLDNIKVQFEESEMNSIINRRIAIFVSLLLLGIPLVLILLMSYLKSR